MRLTRLQADQQSQLDFNTIGTAATLQAINSQPEPDKQATAEHHLSTNINLEWQKLDEYYQNSRLINQSIDERSTVK
jgi:hypothetical protein